MKKWKGLSKKEKAAARKREFDRQVSLCKDNCDIKVEILNDYLEKHPTLFAKMINSFMDHYTEKYWNILLQLEGEKEDNE